MAIVHDGVALFWGEDELGWDMLTASGERRRGLVPRVDGELWGTTSWDYF